MASIRSLLRSVTNGRAFSLPSAAIDQLDNMVRVEKMTLVEAGEAAGVYTASVKIPAGAYLIDVIIHQVALWNAGTSAVMDVGDVTDPNGLFADVNMKATNLLAGESISFGFPGATQGADVDFTLTEGTPNTTAAMHVERRYLPTQRTISAVITTVGAAPTTGETHVLVVYTLPATVTEHSYVAT